MQNRYGSKFFILGSQRSGATLLRLVCDSHPQIYCYGEIGGYDTLEKKMSLPAIERIGFQLPIWTELFVEYECIKKMRRPAEPIFYMLRDPRAVVSSMKLKPNWIKREVEEKFRIWINDEARKLNSHFGDQIRSLKGHPLESIGLAAVFWNYKTYPLNVMRKENWPVLPLWYDDFVKDPRSHLMTMMGVIELPWHDDLLRHHEIKHTEVRNNVALGGTRTDRSIDQDSLHLWEHTLSQDEQNLIMELTETVRSSLEWTKEESCMLSGEKPMSLAI